jgi:hypothetical protein
MFTLGELISKPAACSPFRAKSWTIPLTGLSIFVQETKPEFKPNPDPTKLRLLRALNEEWTDLDEQTKLQDERAVDYVRNSQSVRQYA